VERAVARGQERKESQAVPRLGIDEKAYPKGQSYITLLYDLDDSAVEAISDGNDTESGIARLSQLSEAQIQSVEAIVMDMSAACVKATKNVIPLAADKIVHDRFHMMQMATKAVDKVRRGEHRQLMTDGDDSLSKTKYVWLTSFEILTEKQQTHLRCGIRSSTPDRKGMVVQGNAPRSVGPENRWVGDHFLQQLVPASDSHKTRADEGRGKIHQGASQKRCELLHSQNYQRRSGGDEQQNHANQTPCGRLHKPREFKTAIFFYCGSLSLDPQ
jgi:hypothetical protein